PRFPLTRGEIGWRQVWTLLNPYSPANTVPHALKSDAMRERESRMYRHNVAYVFGYRPETFADAEVRARKAERARVRDERGARIRAAYALLPFDTLRPATASLGRKIGSGAQGDAYEAAGDPRRVVKVFRDATPSQLQEFAAVVNAVADGGAPVARVTLVRLPDGRYGLEMPHFSAEEGWTSLLNYTAFHRGPEARAAEARADETLRAVMRESQRVAGVELADWKAGLGGGISDDYLDNFAYRPKTGELMCFDCVVLW
ncbi:MAG: hypothetical protein KGL74_02305, partial [Elusimicrobia bacterium]|nr:hypothetical protein [Elusimicrobiota bacterium]